MKEDLRSQTFDWKKDSSVEVFFYNKGVHYNNGRSGQSPQFKDRVSYFEDQLEHGNASIRIKDVQGNDIGRYCFILPFSPLRQEPYCTRLVVHAASKIHAEILDVNNSRVQLQCDVQSTSHKTDIHWEDDEGRVYRAPVVRNCDGDRCNTSVTAVVNKTKSNVFFCVVTQEELGHKRRERIHVPEKMFQVCKDPSSIAGVLIGVLIVGILLGVPATLGAIKIKESCRRRWGKAAQNGGPAAKYSGHLQGVQVVQV